MRKMIAITSVILMVLFVFASSYAADTSDAGDWDFNLAPLYLWAVSMDGDMTVMGTTAPLQADFKDIASSLEALFTVHFEGMQKSGWGFLTDVS